MYNENQQVLEDMERTWIRYVRVTPIFVTFCESHLESPSKNATSTMNYYHFTRSWIVIITICINLLSEYQALLGLIGIASLYIMLTAS